MNWGNKIVLAFVAFIAVLVAMVYISVGTDFYLVEEDYYEKELAYESQMQRIRNHNALEEKPVFKVNRSDFKIEISFPGAIVDNMVAGTIMFYRPNTAKFDKEVTLEIGEDGKFLLDISKFPIGAWKAKINWADDAKEYYKEIAFVI